MANTAKNLVFDYAYECQAGGLAPVPLVFTTPTTSSWKLANLLAKATSPYLLQHKDNPVDWQEWGEDAFVQARQRDVPVLLSVGYAACHWCHEMDRLVAVSGF